MKQEVLFLFAPGRFVLTSDDLRRAGALDSKTT